MEVDYYKNFWSNICGEVKVLHKKVKDKSLHGWIKVGGVSNKVGVNEIISSVRKIMLDLKIDIVELTTSKRSIEIKVLKKDFPIAKFYSSLGYNFWASIVGLDTLVTCWDIYGWDESWDLESASEVVKKFWKGDMEVVSRGFVKSGRRKVFGVISDEMPKAVYFLNPNKSRNPTLFVSEDLVLEISLPRVGCKACGCLGHLEPNCTAGDTKMLEIVDKVYLWKKSTIKKENNTSLPLQPSADNSKLKEDIKKRKFSEPASGNKAPTKVQKKVEKDVKASEKSKPDGDAKSGSLGFFTPVKKRGSDKAWFTVFDGSVEMLASKGEEMMGDYMKASPKTRANLLKMLDKVSGKRCGVCLLSVDTVYGTKQGVAVCQSCREDLLGQVAKELSDKYLMDSDVDL